MVLGLDWMEEHNPISFDLRTREVTVQMGTKSVVLKGRKEHKTFSLVKGKGVHKLLKQGIKGLAGHQFLMDEDKEPKQVPPYLLDLLNNFTDVFSEPTALPPQRALDHTIPLKPNTKPVSLRPYRYPYFQKTEVENW